jgi:hypothetical protein
MTQWLNKFLDSLSEFIAHRKGLLPLLGTFLIVINFALQFFPLGWITETNLFLHAGLILALIGFLLSFAL